VPGRLCDGVIDESWGAGLLLAPLGTLVVVVVVAGATVVVVCVGAGLGLVAGGTVTGVVVAEARGCSPELACPVGTRPPLAAVATACPHPGSR